MGKKSKKRRRLNDHDQKESSDGAVLHQAERITQTASEAPTHGVNVNKAVIAHPPPSDASDKYSKKKESKSNGKKKKKRKRNGSSNSKSTEGMLYSTILCSDPVFSKSMYRSRLDRQKVFLSTSYVGQKSCKITIKRFYMEKVQ